MEFYICENCGNIITHLKESGVPVMCCGEIMKELIPGQNGAPEKHIPLIVLNKDNVTIRVSHPMVEEHYIQWIIIETTKGYQYAKLSWEDEPMAEFKLTKDEEFIAAHEYCNLHGLWTSK